MTEQPSPPRPARISVSEASQPALPRGVKARLEAAAPSFGPGDEKVARVLLEQADAVIYQSVNEVAAAADTSTATVVRFAQKLGLKGFHELKLAVAHDLRAFERRPNGGRSSVIDRVTSAAAQSARDVAELVDPASFDSAVRMLSAARRVLWVATGSSGLLAQEGAYLCRAAGVEADAHTDVHVQHIASRQLLSDDVCVAISQTGSTRETLTAAETAKTAGAQNIVITSYLSSPLTQIADVVLVAGSRAVDYGPEGTERRLGLLVVVHALLVGVAEEDRERSRHARDQIADVMNEHLL